MVGEAGADKREGAGHGQHKERKRMRWTSALVCPHGMAKGTPLPLSRPALLTMALSAAASSRLVVPSDLVWLLRAETTQITSAWLCHVPMMPKTLSSFSAVPRLVPPYLGGQWRGGEPQQGG